MFVRRTLGCACDGMLDPRGAARPSTESPGGCYVTARHDVATVGESLTGLSERSARHVLVGRGIVKSLKRSGCAAVSRTHKTKSLCDRSGLQTALLVTLTALGVTLTVPSLAQAEQGKCSNTRFRTGPSAGLPDCRAYELVTPEDLGRTQAMTFTGADHAIPSADGERLALETFAPLEPNPSFKGTRAVISRTTQGWTMKSVVAPGAGGEELGSVGAAFRLISPDLSQVAFESEAKLEKSPGLAFEVSPVGGPYARVALIPSEYQSQFGSANPGTANVPAFTDVLFESTDHQVLLSGPEGVLAEETLPGAYNLYDWTEGKLRLVNVEGEGAHLHLINDCGARLGAAGLTSSGASTLGAVSADGSKIFFVSPGPGSCGPPRLYMRVDGRETVEVSKPAAGVEPKPSEYSEVRYNAATPDGSKVAFNTSTPLLPGETASENRLFMYDTVTGELKLIAGFPEAAVGTQGRFVILSEDGSAVYYTTNESIYRYEWQSGETNFVAAISTPALFFEPSYTTPNGQFLVFVGGRDNPVEVAGPHGLEPELRGAGHNELYRYDAAVGSVMCVSCGEGAGPAEGAMLEPSLSFSDAVLQTQDGTPPFIQMTEDGQKVFFETTAQLVPQDTNNPTITQSSAGGFPGMDVYEWEANGAEEAPGVFCRVAVGCTHLLSSGEDVGPEYFLGASMNGRNAFFSSAAHLTPQATPEFSNIYDARVDGGFPPPPPVAECSSCQGVGSPSPLFGIGASGSFVGSGNHRVVVKSQKEGKKGRKKKRRKKKGKGATRGKSATHTKGRGR